MYTWRKTTRPIHSITEVELLITFTLTSSCQPINQPVRFNLYIFSVINFHHVSLSFVLRLENARTIDSWTICISCVMYEMYIVQWSTCSHWLLEYRPSYNVPWLSTFVTLSTSAAEARKQVIGLYRNLVVNQQRANIILLSENCSFGPAEILWLMIRSWKLPHHL